MSNSNHHNRSVLPPTISKGGPDEDLVGDQPAVGETTRISSPTADSNVFGGRIVTILVGPDKQKFTVHERVLSVVSEAGRKNFFGVLFDSGFREANTGCVELPEDDPKQFQHVIKWFYAVYIGTSAAVDLARMDLTELFKLYIVAQKYLIDCLQDRVIDAVYAKLETDDDVVATIVLDSAGAFHEFKANMPSFSPLYKLVLRSLAVSMLQPLGTIPGPRNFYQRYVSGDRAGADGWEGKPHQTEAVLAEIPDELLRPFLQEMLQIKMLRVKMPCANTMGCHQTFRELVGPSHDYYVTPPIQNPANLTKPDSPKGRSAFRNITTYSVEEVAGWADEDEAEWSERDEAYM